MQSWKVITGAGAVFTLGVITAWKVNEFTPAILPGLLGFMIGTSVVFLRSVATPSRFTTALQVLLIGLTIGALWQLSGGEELFLVVVTASSIVVAESVVAFR